MTPKEKADELVEKFTGGLSEKLEMYNSEILIGAKQCALICVDEKIKTGIELNGEMFSGFIERLQDIKEEINKL